jgi:hypothetical protein
MICKSIRLSACLLKKKISIAYCCDKEPKFLIASMKFYTSFKKHYKTLLKAFWFFTG